MSENQSKNSLKIIDVPLNLKIHSIYLKPLQILLLNLYT